VANYSTLKNVILMECHMRHDLVVRLRIGAVSARVGTVEDLQALRKDQAECRCIAFATFSKLDMLPSSGEDMESPILLDLLQRTNHIHNGSSNR
jgi:hypothetical protein